LPSLTVESVLATGMTWKDFRRFLRDKIVVVTIDVHVCSEDFYYGLVLRLGDGEDKKRCVSGQGRVRRLLQRLCTSGAPSMMMEQRMKNADEMCPPRTANV
jgi:hypothetical protein